MKIYTVIPYFSDGVTVNENDVNSFESYKAAYEYATIQLKVEHYSLVPNELVKVKINTQLQFGTDEFNEAAARFFGGGGFSK